ncbi:hypothetical protein [Chryseobacterium hagamense]|uniref:Uncharacterized protein n=1 Tax=Chryseobacterium hagamense TaxID=395935 RepID=A0A511YGJ1_9FLAO|nr:hypothetical protein [Chryseobacterium hagamense]GEN74308.1 hypothetical protein CHA01nite_00480 [Chryseobacterium hagamense]
MIAGKAGKGPVFSPSEAGASEILLHSLPEEEYRDPVSVFRRAFKACRREELEDFLATVTYFSLGEFRCEEEKKLVVPYIHLMKMLDAAWLIVKRTSDGEPLTPKAHEI